MGVKQPSTQKGFILAAVLWALAILLVIVGVLHTYVERKLAIGLVAKQSLQNRVDQYSTEQTVLYLVSTSRTTLAGFTRHTLSLEQMNSETFSIYQAVGDEIHVDASVYQGLGAIRFSIQDRAGLLSLNSKDLTDIERLLTSLNVSPVNRTKLVDAILDYVDSDSDAHISGAESNDYRARSLSPPANDLLRTEQEITRVMGWAELLKAKQLSPEKLMSIRQFALFNLNAMPLEIYRFYLGLDESVAKHLIESRYTNPIRSYDDFILRTGALLPLDDERFRTLTSPELNLRFWPKGGSQAKVISLQLSPNGDFGPWLVDYEYSSASVDDTQQPLVLEQNSLLGDPLGDH